MTEPEQFQQECRQRVAGYAANRELARARDAFMLHSTPAKYSYNFTWLGLPIIQYPQDIVAMQEIIWAVRPDLIVETGVARGGSLVFYASLLELLGGERTVVGIDVDIRAHNRAAIERHPLSRRIRLLEGSSTDDGVLSVVRGFASRSAATLVALDSNHSHEHVLRELELYAPLVSVGSYCVVFDTIIEYLPRGFYPDRSWDVGRNPATAVAEFLKSHPEFAVDCAIDDKLLVSVAPGGYLRRVS